MTHDVLDIAGLNKWFGGLRATNDIMLSVREGEIHAIIGPNGAGKTTLLSQIQGLLRPDDGYIKLDGEDITYEPAHKRARRGIARSFQITSLISEFPVITNAALGVQARLGHSFRFWKQAGSDLELLEPALEALRLVGLDRRAGSLVRDLSHGERRQLELAIALAQKPRLLLLDEPMAGMGRQDTSRMISLIAGLKGQYSIILIEHDMDAVFTLADRISVLVAGHVIKTGTPEQIRNDADVRAAYLGH
ncbi:MAG: ABC transporter ATP-binding protein [Xanthobacteraceae bacterium]|nr:MAG: ABC transporter ATP-binding protein [Xanthobacteraceae bacterium]